MSGKAIRETLGFLAVVASLVFVGAEIQQDTRSMQVSAYQDLIQQISLLNTLTFENPEFGALVTGDAAAFTGEGGPLTDSEEAQLDSFLWLLFRHADMAFYQHERGLLSAERLRSATMPMTTRLSYPIFQGEWEQRRAAFSQGYQSYVDSIIAARP